MTCFCIQYEVILLDRIDENRLGVLAHLVESKRASTLGNGAVMRSLQLKWRLKS